MPDTLGIDIGGSSIKASALRGGQILWTGQSSFYENPTQAALILALHGTLAGRTLAAPVAVGLCLPGLFDPASGSVTQAINLPVLVGISIRELLTRALGQEPASVTVVSDAHAAAHDLYLSRKVKGRLFFLAIGTGVGAAVLDDGPALLGVDGDSPGHWGQLDVSLDDRPPLGPDGGAGSLEGYLGVAALRSRYGPDFIAAMPKLPVSEPPLRALIRALRIAHALYRPQHIILAGGIGLSLAGRLGELHAATSQNLTRIARPGWQLTCADHLHHAAIGAARLARTAG